MVWHGNLGAGRGAMVNPLKKSVLQFGMLRVWQEWQFFGSALYIERVERPGHQ
jgi:hypothetical protein